MGIKTKKNQSFTYRLPNLTLILDDLLVSHTTYFYRDISKKLYIDKFLTALQVSI